MIIFLISLIYIIYSLYFNTTGFNITEAKFIFKLSEFKRIKYDTLIYKFNLD